MEEPLEYAIGVSGPEDDAATIERKLKEAGKLGWRLVAVATHNGHTLHYLQTRRHETGLPMRLNWT